MFAAHFSAGLALKAKVPEASTVGILIGVGLLDILFGPLVMLGVERATVTPGISPGFSLDYIDWSHSLVTSVVWSVLYALAFVRAGARVATVMGVAVFSHFVLDLVMHPSDLALWPGAETHLGFGLWRVLPGGWWFVELALVAITCAYYWHRAGRSTRFGGRRTAVVATILVLHVLNSPWLSAY